ncbi:unnamed protein product, partial [Nesidiocoris tenuis]
MTSRPSRRLQGSQHDFRTLVMTSRQDNLAKSLTWIVCGLSLPLSLDENVLSSD